VGVGGCSKEQEMGCNITCICAFLLLLVVFASSHSTIYPHRKLDRIKKENAGVGALPSPPPGIISYHIHVTYTLFNPPVVERALALRNHTRHIFKDFLGPDCPGRYDYGYLCMIADHDLENTTLIGGPFVSGEWSMFIPVGYHDLVVPWMMQNRGEFSIVVHPNTGYEYEDHSLWAMWAGQVWPLDMTIFDQGNQTNEFGHHPGDSDNPVCLPKGTVCGDTMFGLGPSTLCCFGLACSAAESVNQINPNQIYRCL